MENMEIRQQVKLEPGDIGHSFWNDIIQDVTDSGKKTLANFLTVENKPNDETVKT